MPDQVESGSEKPPSGIQGINLISYKLVQKVPDKRYVRKIVSNTSRKFVHVKNDGSPSLIYQQKKIMSRHRTVSKVA